MSSKKIDIHNYDRGYDSTLEHLERAEIPEQDKNLIKEFNDICGLEKLSKPRKMKIIGYLVLFRKKFLDKNFKDATREDLKKSILKLENIDNYSVWTKQSYSSIIKKFYSWLVYGDEYKENVRENGYPKIVSFIKINIAPKDKPKIKASDLLTEEEIKKIIDSADNLRDKAFISVLYECGARIGEIGNIQIKHISRGKKGLQIDIKGKTGERTPIIIFSVPYLTAWLNEHPMRDNPDAPLWVHLNNKSVASKNLKRGEALGIGALSKIIKRLVTKAGIKKRVYPHLFRHTRVTHVLINGELTESQAKVYFGWTPDSRMFSQYSKVTSEDVNNKILQMNGLVDENDKKEILLKPIECTICKSINKKESKFCNQCGNPLSLKTAVEISEKREQADDQLAELLKIPEIRNAIVSKLKQSR